MARPPRNDVKNEFAYWLATPRRLRVSLNLPNSEKAFSEMKGVNVRTLRRWKEQDDFNKLVSQRKMEIANASPNSTISRVGPPRPAEDPRTVSRLTPPDPVRESDDPSLVPGLTQDEQRYLQVKDTLVQMAMDGNQGAIDLYLKHYGKSFVEAEQSKFDDYAQLSDQGLVDEFCQWAGIEAVADWLARQTVDA